MYFNHLSKLFPRCVGAGSPVSALPPPPPHTPFVAYSNEDISVGLNPLQFFYIDLDRIIWLQPQAVLLPWFIWSLAGFFCFFFPFPFFGKKARFIEVLFPLQPEDKLWDLQGFLQGLRQAWMPPPSPLAVVLEGDARTTGAGWSAPWAQTLPMALTASQHLACPAWKDGPGDVWGNRCCHFPYPSV